MHMSFLIVVFLPLLTFVLPMIASSSELTEIGNKYGNDKGPSHDYLVIYEQYFAPIKNKKLKILEIGFFDGSSAHMWEEYFPNAELHYIDINEECRRTAKNLSSRSFLHIGDQSDTTFLASIINLVGEFDIIIDDASHQCAHQILSFEYLFPHVKSGGIYIIEDLHTSYWKFFGGEGSPGNPCASINSTTEYLKQLTDYVNYVGAYTGCANRELAKIRVDIGRDRHGTYNFPKDFFEKLDYRVRDLKSLHFYDSLCFIFKR